MDGRARGGLVVAAAQPFCVAGDVEANARAHAAAVREAAARVVAFPEMSLTGYELDAPVVATNDPRLAPLVDACADTGTLALAGAPVAGADGRAHIGVLVVTGTGVAVGYHKMWLGPAEAERFAPGRDPAVVEVDGWRLGLAVCKDTGIAQHAADTAAAGIDVYVAGVLEHAGEAAVPGERARRIAADHRVPVVIASFAGSTGGGYAEAAGGSGIWTADGQVLSRVGPEVGAIARGTLT